VSDYFNLSGKTILVTGAAGILGRQHVDALVSAGATVVATDVDEKSISQICTQINSKYNVELATPRYMDVTNRENIISVIEEYERIDILINNAAKDFKVEGTGELSKEGRFETMSYTRWKSDMEVGLGGCFLCSQAVANKMLSTGGGNIINIASDLSVIAPDQRIYRKEGLEAHEQNVKPVTYTVSKSAVVGLTKYMATYFADKNIRVNSLSPAGIYNEDMPQDFVDKLTSLIPMGRMANPGEYGGAIVFLCSDASEYMTGVNLVIDGGRTVW